MSTTRSSTIVPVPPDVVEVHQYARTATIVDVRERDDVVRDGWIGGSLHVPLELISVVADPRHPAHAPELDPARPVILCCGDGSRATTAAERLVDLGYTEVGVLAGGIAAWRRAGRAIAGTKSWHTAPQPRGGAM